MNIFFELYSKIVVIPIDQISIIQKILIYIFLTLLFATINYFFIIFIRFLISILFAKNKLISFCKNSSFKISKIDTAILGVKLAKDREEYIPWNFTYELEYAIASGNKIIIINGRARTGKTRTVLEILKSFSDRRYIKKFDNKTKYIKSLKKYLFIYPLGEEINNILKIKLMPRLFFFKKPKYILFLDDVLDLKIQNYKIFELLNFFLKNSNDLIVIMAHRSESTRLISSEEFIKDIEKSIFIKNKKRLENYKELKIIDVKVTLETLKELNDAYTDKKDINYLENTNDGTLQPIYYEEFYNFFKELNENQKKIIFAAILIAYSTINFFNRKLLHDVFKSKVFNGETVEFSNSLSKILEYKLINKIENNEIIYEIDNGIKNIGEKIHPECCNYDNEKIRVLINACFNNGEYQRLSFVGNSLFFEKRYKEAETAFKKSLDLEEKQIFVWVNLGVSLNFQGKTIEAESTFRKAIEIDINSKEAWTNLGTSIAMNNNYKRAEDTFRKAIEIDPNYKVAWYNLGLSLNKQGKYEEEEKAHRKVIELDPSYKEAWVNLGLSLNKQGKYEEEEKIFRKAIELGISFDLIFYNLGNCLIERGKYEEAEKTFRKAIELNPNLKEAWYNLGLSLSHQSRYEEAEKAHRKAIELDPSYKEALIGLGTFLGLQDKNKEAEEIFRQAIKIDNYSKEALFGLRLSLNKQGKYNEEKEILKKMKQL